MHHISSSAIWGTRVDFISIVSLSTASVILLQRCWTMTARHFRVQWRFWCWWGWSRTQTVLPCFWAEDPDANRNSRKHIVLMLRRMKCKDRKHGRMNTLAKLSRDNKKFEVWLRNEHHYTRIVCGKKYVVFNLLSVVQVLVLPVPPLEKPSIFVGDYDAIPCKNQNQHQIRLEETKQWKVNEVR